MILYKLTDENMRTPKDAQWELGVWRETSGNGAIGDSSWLHAHSDPLLAVLLNPAHADFSSPRLFEAEGDGAFRDDRGLKCGVTRMRLVRELPMPVVTTEQRVRFAILCALEVYHDSAWVTWANNWLSGADRTSATARTASWAADAAAEAAESNTAWAEAKAAWEALGRVKSVNLAALAREAMREPV